MTDHDTTGDGELVLTLQDLIRSRMDERGWNASDLARRSDDKLTRGRWDQLSRGQRLKAFPEPSSIQVMANALEVDVTTILLAAAQSLGIDARRRGPDLAQLLPAGTDRLSVGTRDAILTIIRATVADTLTTGSGADDDTPGTATLRWSKSDTAGAAQSVREADVTRR